MSWLSLGLLRLISEMKILFIKGTSGIIQIIFIRNCKRIYQTIKPVCEENDVKKLCFLFKMFVYYEWCFDICWSEVKNVLFL